MRVIFVTTIVILVGKLEKNLIFSSDQIKSDILQK